jgi:hemerythrin-like domain-containing protein
MSSDADPWELISALPSVPFVQTLDSDIQGLLAADMSLVHNVFIRGLNSIWRNAPLVKPNDVDAFAGYSITCIRTIHEHHHGEEKIVFPYLQTKLDMSHNLEQHEGFHAGMDAFEDYMKKVQNKEETFDAEKTRELVKAFADPLVQHLHEEVRWFALNTVV